jgi:hypothetical protein
MTELDATCPTCTERGKGTYRLRGHCVNCGWRGFVILSKGHDARPRTCPNCDCLTVQPKPWETSP